MRALAAKPPVQVFKAPEGTQYITSTKNGTLQFYRKHRKELTDLLLVYTKHQTWALSLFALEDIKNNGNYIDLMRDNNADR